MKSWFSLSLETALPGDPVSTRYAFDSSSVSFKSGVIYGLSILVTILKYLLFKCGIIGSAIQLENEASPLCCWILWFHFFSNRSPCH
jgi:hypothetical protein